MKIVSIGPGHPLRGGISNFNTALCRNLAGAGHRVTIVSFSLQYPGFFFPGSSQYDPGDAPGNASGRVPVLPLINSVNPFSWIRTVRRIRREAPGLLILHHWMPFIALSMGGIVRRLGRDRKFPVIAVCHNVIPHEKQAGWKFLSRRLLSRCDGFVVLSRSVLDDLSLFTDSAFRVFVPHPVYDLFGDAVERADAAAYLEQEPGNSYLLFFGLVRRYKGLDILLRALSLVRDRLSGLKLIIAGEFYGGTEEYNRLVEELGIGDRIVLHDRYIPSREVKYYFSLADLVVQPYRTATQSGISQIAYHFGVPMLVTDVGGLAEIVPHGKVGYVTPVDEQAVADAVIDFFRNDRSAEFRRNISTERRKFSWDGMSGKILDLAEQIRKSR